MSEYLIQTVEESAAQVLFATLLLFLFAISLAAVLFGVLLVRAIFRWLTRHSWNDVIVSGERKALERVNVSRQRQLGANGGK